MSKVGDLFLFGLVRQYSTNQNQYNKDRFKLQSHGYLVAALIPLHSGSALQRELDFCNGYLTLLYHTVQNGRVILDKLPRTFDT